MPARHVNRATVHWALRVASETLATRPEDLDPADYERLRAEPANVDLPSHVAVALAFGGWRRACRYAGVSYPPPTEEARIADALYGHPRARRQLQVADRRN
jgi:hypothetical protein